jgi:hypothetical protein
VHIERIAAILNTHSNELLFALLANFSYILAQTKGSCKRLYRIRNRGFEYGRGVCRL